MAEAREHHSSVNLKEVGQTNRTYLYLRHSSVLQFVATCKPNCTQRFLSPMSLWANTPFIISQGRHVQLEHVCLTRVSSVSIRLILALPTKRWLIFRITVHWTKRPKWTRLRRVQLKINLAVKIGHNKTLWWFQGASEFSIKRRLYFWLRKQANKQTKGGQ